LPESDAADGGDHFAIGAKVYHASFGRGVIKRREGRGDAAKAWILFERGGLKLLVLKFANLKPVAG
jgi:DNA helicase-2/ATP-dependent DNA helicase PcrA